MKSQQVLFDYIALYISWLLLENPEEDVSQKKKGGSFLPF